MPEQLDFTALNKRLLPRIESLLCQWLPEGRRAGHEYIARNPKRNDKKPGSFKVNLTTGAWGDFAIDGIKGGDLISLYAYLNGLRQGETAKILAGENALPKPFSPPPHSKLGHASAHWGYTDVEGHIVSHVCRFDTASGKEYRCYASGQWRAPSAPRPLYGLHRLHARLDVPVLLVEGEKAADAAAKLFPDHVCTTTMNGAKAVSKADFTPLKGRGVVIWPDNDTAGQEYAQQVSRAIAGLVKSCAVTTLPKDLPDKWDLADTLPVGITLNDLQSTLQSAAPVAVANHHDTSESTAAQDEFETNGKGAKLINQTNFDLALSKLDVTLRYDEFSRKAYINDAILDDANVKRLMFRFDAELGLDFTKANKTFFFDLIMDRAASNKFHPVKEYLQSLHWDGKERIDTWLIFYGGAKDTDYVREIGRLWLMAAVKRVIEPGCKFDQMLVMEGKEGKNKSTALAILAVREDWFTDQMAFPRMTDVRLTLETLTGKWIVESADLAGIRKAEVETLKACLSRRIDSARLAYARFNTELPRQCVFAGTTNDSQYLMSSTGNRRFWPVAIKEFDIKALRRDRDQLWAEAYHRRHNVSLMLDSDFWEEASEEQEKRRLTDPWEEVLATYAEEENFIIAEDLWRTLGVDKDKRTQRDNVRLGAIMRAMGFKRTRRRANDDLYDAGGRGRVWGYQRIEEAS